MAWFFGILLLVFLVAAVAPVVHAVVTSRGQARGHNDGPGSADIG